ncbi:MAG TPA: hypothetical protein VHZ24_00840 [Pirellulales bacterium]|nr:hypothetical protein [Pirellulales bacterium]
MTSPNDARFTGPQPQEKQRAGTAPSASPRAIDEREHQDPSPDEIDVEEFDEEFDQDFEQDDTDLKEFEEELNAGEEVELPIDGEDADDEEFEGDEDF